MFGYCNHNFRECINKPSRWSINIASKFATQWKFGRRSDSIQRSEFVLSHISLCILYVYSLATINISNFIGAVHFAAQRHGFFFRRAVFEKFIRLVAARVRCHAWHITCRSLSSKGLSSSFKCEFTRAQKDFIDFQIRCHIGYRETTNRITFLNYSWRSAVPAQGERVCRASDGSST